MIRSILATLLATLAAVSALAGPPVYKIELVPNRHGLHPGTAYALSPRGEVAGTADVEGGTHVAYRSRKGKVVALPDSDRAHVHGINDASSVAGMNYFLTEGHIWHADGTREDLGDWWTTGINASGQVSGSSSRWDGVAEAAIYHAGTITRLGRLGGLYSDANAINDAGQVAGTAAVGGYYPAHAFRWEGGVMTDLGTLGGDNSYGNAISPLGHVAGMTEDAAGRRRAFVHDGASMRALPPAKGGLHFATAVGINRHGEVVGNSFDGALLHARNGKTYRLAELLDASGGEWEQVVTAEAINDAGQVTGIGVRNGFYRAYLATPVKTATR
jgi:probable HAF family extracellular repeat protein